MGKSPTPSALTSAGYCSIRAFATTLATKYAADFGFGEEHPGSLHSLQINLANLFKGQELIWWRNRILAARRVADELGITLDALQLERDLVQHPFSFSTFPTLPALNLAHEDRYRIAAPFLVSEPARTFEQSNLHYWLHDERYMALPQCLDWLQIDDPTEFNLVTAHLAANSRHMTLRVDHPLQEGGADTDVLHHGASLILAVAQKVSADQLQALRARARVAPLLVVSPYALPESVLRVSAQADGVESEDTTGPQNGLHARERAPEAKGKVTIEVALGKVNCWRWVLHDDWRDTLLQWVAHRLAHYQVASVFRASSIRQWLDRVDPDQRWFPHIADVLRLCQVAVSEPGENLDGIEDNRGSAALIERLFSISEPHRKHLEGALLSRWCAWQYKWDQELPPQDWIACGVKAKRFDSMKKTGLVVLGDGGYGFADRVLCRLLLRRVIDKLVRTGSPATWWPACFDHERRPLLDATLGVMTPPGLNAAASRLVMHKQWQDSLMGPAEALFVAIGRQLAKGRGLQGRMSEVGDLILSRAVLISGEVRPWSRPVVTVEQVAEWCSALWVWVLRARPQVSGSREWCLPSWASESVDHETHWLNPRAGLYDGKRAVPTGAAWDLFIDVSSRWSETLSEPPIQTIALLLRPALVHRAACQFWRIDANWWRGIIGEEWAEIALVSMLSLLSSEQQKAAAGCLWPSVVRWQRDVRGERPMGFTPGNELVLPSCRAGAPKYSRVLEWVASRLSDEDVLGLLDGDDRRFLEEHPQWLLTRHKLALLAALASRLPLAISSFQVWNYFSPYLPDAADGLNMFLADQILGAAAAVGVWNWVPERALMLLDKQIDKDDALAACGQLVLNCPADHLGAAMAALRRRPELLSNDARGLWIRYHLPNAGHLAGDLMLLNQAS